MAASHDAGALHPGWLKELWPALREEQVGLLLGNPRVQRRLLGMVAARQGWAEADDGPLGDVPGAALARAPRAAIEAAAAMAGAVWHARAIRRVIATRDVEHLQSQIGADTRSFALANIALAVAPPEQASAEPLAQRISAAASLCLAAWLAALPAGLQRLAVPKLPPSALSAAVPKGSEAPALAIMACVTAHMATSLAAQEG